MTGPDEEVRRLIAQGNALEDAGRLHEARDCYQAAMELAPTSPRPLLNLGNSFRAEGRIEEAIAITRRAVAIAPQFAPAWFNLGLLLQQAGGTESAEKAFRAALRIDSALTDASIALAHLLDGSGRPAEATAELERAMQANPTRAAPAHNLALPCIERHNLDAAESLLTRAMQAEPGFALTYASLADVCFRSGRAREAEAWYSKALSLDPSARDVSMAWLFSLNARDDLTPQRVFEMHREFAQVVERVAPTPPSPDSAMGSGRRLRVGYLSPDFRAHAVALFIYPVLAHHDRDAFEVFCYDNGREDHDLTRRFRGLVEHWRSVVDLDDARAVELIRADRLDLLVDLAGYTRGSRVLLFPWRCARVQATWLGYLHSTGLRSADVRICDAQTDPPRIAELLHTERLARLPNSLWCYDPIHHAMPPRAHGARRCGPVVFGSFNQFWKISDTTLDLWLRILRQLPDAQLRVVGVPSGKTMQRFGERLREGGLGDGRVTLSPTLDIDRYFETLAGTDVAFDTQPYNGATTTLDALWSGTPVVALAGDRSVSRSGVSILRAAGLAELIAGSADEYVAINLRLARDERWRSQLRATLRDRLAASPLMDAARFTRDVEVLYRRICGVAAG